MGRTLNVVQSLKRLNDSKLQRKIQWHLTESPENNLNCKDLCQLLTGAYLLSFYV